MTAKSLITELNLLNDNKKAKLLSGFFKTGEGEYGEGDKFIGVTVPQIRILAKKYQFLSLLELQKIISSNIHEHRLTALLILTYQYPKVDKFTQKQIVNFYLKNLKYINNWDLVDLSTPRILGNYYYSNPGKEILYKLAGSQNLWFRRIAILATFEFIRNKSFDDSIKISEILLNDGHDLIHKAVGWMLREIGKRDLKVEENFLKKHYKRMPRTMLRYAIERFDTPRRDFFMKK
jgi:3-methyladenine DNA glycosylase AlkD